MVKCFQSILCSINKLTKNYTYIYFSRNAEWYDRFVSELPEFIQKILLETGFDTEISLEELEEENVKFIEDFVEENRHLLAGTIYEKKNANEFKFLIGHRALLLALPRKIKEANSKKETTNKKIKKNVENYSELKEEEKVKLKED